MLYVIRIIRRYYKRFLFLLALYFMGNYAYTWIFYLLESTPALKTERQQVKLVSQLQLSFTTNKSSELTVLSDDDFRRFQEQFRSASHWQPVMTSSRTRQIYVYSAYKDITTASSILVMGITTVTVPSVWCVMFFEKARYTYWTARTAHLSPLPGGYALRFVSIQIACPVDQTSEFPSFVAITTLPSPDYAKNLLRVNSIERIPEVRNFTVCVAPLTRQYGDHGDQFIEFIEFVEVNSIFGASHFVLYNVSIGRKLHNVVKQYEREGYVTVLPWDLPVRTEQNGENEIHYYGQVVALNDCILRSRPLSRYVVVIDTDELLVPLKRTSWVDMMSNVGANYSAYVFANVFMRKEWQPDPESVDIPLVTKYGIRTLKYTKREVKIFGHRMRSKYIADPMKVAMAGIHFVEQFVSGGEYNIKASDGLLIHYRNWEKYGDSAFVVERRMYNFKNEIVLQIESRLARLGLN